MSASDAFLRVVTCQPCYAAPLRCRRCYALPLTRRFYCFYAPDAVRYAMLLDAVYAPRLRCYADTLPYYAAVATPRALIRYYADAAACCCRYAFARRAFFTPCRYCHALYKRQMRRLLRRFADAADAAAMVPYLLMHHMMSATRCLYMSLLLRHATPFMRPC